MNDYLQEALKQFRDGWRVIPLEADSEGKIKKPTIRGWTRWVYEPQTEEEVVEMFSYKGVQGLGRLLYPATPWIVGDGDGIHYEDALAQLSPETRRLIHQTARVETPSGGVHYYLSAPADNPDLKRLTRKIRLLKSGCECIKECGFDLIVHKGFVAAPPTRGYVESADFPLHKAVTIPEEIISIALANQHHSRKNSADDETARIPEGRRHITLVSLAGSMRRSGITVEGIKAALVVENQRCEPPLSEDDINKIVGSAGNWERGSAYDRIVLSLSKDELEEPAPSESKDGEIQSIAFPEEAWTGPFARWREIVAPCTEAPLEFCWLAFLVAAGMCFGRNVWRESPIRLYPNFYGLLLGRTGDLRKSTVLWLARQLLNLLGEEVRVLAGVVSSEGIYQALGEREAVKAIIYVDEFRALLSVARRKGTQDILPKLNTLYYCPDKDSIDRRKDPVTIINPFVSMLAATPEDYIKDLLTERELSGGFLNRFLVVTGQEQADKPIVRAPSRLALQRLGQELLKLRPQLPLREQVGMSSDAVDLWSEFYLEWKAERRQWQPRQVELTARTSEHILKMGLLYAVLSGSHEIDVRSLAIAIRLGGWLQSNTLAVFESVGLDTFGECERIIIEILKQARKGRMWRRDLQRKLSSRRFNGEIFNRAVRALETNDIVRTYDVTVPSGRNRSVVELLQ